VCLPDPSFRDKLDSLIAVDRCCCTAEPTMTHPSSRRCPGNMGERTKFVAKLIIASLMALKGGRKVSCLGNSRLIMT
jgi:hypothetical protein